MNEEERQALCAELRRIAKEEQWWSYVGLRCNEAAEEIERLAAELDRVKNWRAHAEGALLQISGITANYTRNVIEAECEYGATPSSRS